MKKFLILVFISTWALLLVNAQDNNTLFVNASQGEHKISEHIYGHFAEHLGRCIYGGIWVGEDSEIPNIEGYRKDVMKALQEIDVPVLRWPGGCFADIYHWKDGIGPRDERPEILNIFWGNVVENNSFGTHEFMRLCELLDCEPYISGNLGSGTVKEMADWVEYLTSPEGTPMADLRANNGRKEPWMVKFWGIGNESWGCGGRMSPGYYVDKAANYNTYLRNFGDNQLYRIACGGYADRGDYEWTELLMKNGYKRMGFDAHAIHYYTGLKESATDFNEDAWADIMNKTLKMNDIIQQNIAIMDRYDPEKKVDLIIDEWGTWYAPEKGTNPRFLYQQNTIRDAIVAATNLNIFNNNCERVFMTNIAQTVNVLQAMILTRETEMVKTPTYYVYKMFAPHQNAIMIPTDLNSVKYNYNDIEINALNASASLTSEGILHISLVNLDPVNIQPVSCKINNMDFEHITARIITSNKINDYNDFGEKESVSIIDFEDFKVKKGFIEINLPPKSIVMFEVN